MELKSKNTETIEGEVIKDKTIRKTKPVKYEGRNKEEIKKVRKILEMFKWNVPVVTVQE